MDPKYCSSCGHQLSTTVQFCPNCGKKLETQVIEEVIEVKVNEEESTSNDQDELLKLYANSDEYVEKWRKESKWNWAAFLFGPFWMGYRKMYVEAAIYIGVICILSAIESALGSPSGSQLVYLLVSIALGRYGNRIYYRKAMRSIEKILVLQKEKVKRHYLISKKGGTTGWGIAYGLIVFIGGIILIGVIANSLSSGAIMTSSKSKIIFAEKVDDQLRAIHPGTTFTTGKVVILLQTDSEFAVNKVNITITKRNGGTEQILDKYVTDVDPKWAVFKIDYPFSEKGHYRVSISKPSGELIGEGSMDIN